MELLDIEPDLLEVDISDGSYNFSKDTSKGHDPKKLVYRTGSHMEGIEENDLVSRLKFSSKTEDLEKFGGNERVECQICQKKYMYFCPKCRIPMECTKNVIPKVKIPVKIDIIKDCREVDGKSSAVHAKLIANEDVEIYDTPVHDIPEYLAENTFLIFPSENAQSLDDVKFVNRQSKFVFIDATWKQARQLSKSKQLKDLPRISLKDYKTLFWRYQTGESDSNLATIEAIYYFLVEYSDAVLKRKYDGEFDDLLFLFMFYYKKIHRLHGLL